MYLGLGAISTGTKSFVSATVDSDGVITPGSTISNIITGDWALGYVSTDPKTASVYYWSGTAWTATTAQAYVSSAAYDILNLTTGGYTVTNYTIIMNAIIKNLMVQNMQLLAGGKIYAGTGIYGNSNTPIFLGYDDDDTAKFALGDGLTYDGTDLSITGDINAISGVFKGEVGADATLDYYPDSTSSNFIADTTAFRLPSQGLYSAYVGIGYVSCGMGYDIFTFKTVISRDINSTYSMQAEVASIQSSVSGGLVKGVTLTGKGEFNTGIYFEGDATGGTARAILINI